MQGQPIEGASRSDSSSAEDVLGRLQAQRTGGGGGGGEGGKGEGRGKVRVQILPLSQSNCFVFVALPNEASGSWFTLRLTVCMLRKVQPHHQLQV